MNLKKIKGLIIITFLFACIFGLTAIDFLNDMEEGEINGFPTIKGVTDSGIEVTVIQVIPADDPEMEARIAGLIGSFKTIPVNTVRITVKPGKLAELYITNGPFTWKEYDMGEYLPSGFNLKLDGAIDYDADLFVDRLHIRLEGFYRSEAEFLDKIVSVVDDPGTFLMSRDPEYILNTFMSMMSADEEIEEKIETREAEAQEFETTLLETIEELKIENAALKEALDELKYNNLIMEARSLFGGIRMIDRDAVDWIVDRKTANPGMTGEELGAGLTADTGAELKSKQIALILALYFGEYPE